MYKGCKFLAIIPARGGSKGIPNKNIIDVEGRSLIDYTIKEALASKYLDSVIVSTDSLEISRIAVECGASVPFLRPKELASDESRTIDALLHTIKNLSQQGLNYDYLVLLQPTQPLRKSFHIDESIEKIVSVGEETLVSVSRVTEHPILMRSVDNKGILKSLLNKDSTIRRQDFPEYYKVNGAIYINKINVNLNEETSLNDNRLPYIMDSIYDVDIDEPIDLEIFKMLVSKY